MNIETITIPHPNINDRSITLLIIDNKIDIPSTEFLIYESRFGGRFNSIAGKTSHKGKAIHLLELYKNLHKMGLSWDVALESDIQTIRNAMLCWDSNDNEDYHSYEYEPIKNDTMNHKLNTWFKFYKYMNTLKIQNNMVLCTKRVKSFNSKKMLDHLKKRYASSDNEYIDIWKLKVNPSPKEHIYHALTRTEFSILRKYLREIDLVYEVIALVMVETGLRIRAILEIKKDDFSGLFKFLANGKNIDDIIKRDYIAKGGMKKQYDLPLRVLEEINSLYLRREYIERLYSYEKRCERLGKEIDSEVFWIKKSGKEIKFHDIWSVFSKASIQMNRKVNKITPHWLRHTFATWTIIDLSERKGIALENTGSTPNPIFIIALQQKLGHADALTTMRYISTALRIMGLTLNDGYIKISLRSFLRDKNSQKLVEREAKSEFGEDFDDDYFDVVKYAISREIVINDEIIASK